MAKGLAVSQIILLVLGIIVLAVVAYLLYTQFVDTGGTITAEQCRAEATRICTGCTIGNTLDDCQYSPTSTALKSDGTTTTVDSSMTKCVQKSYVQAGTGTNTINCRVVTGQTQAATQTNPSPNPTTTPAAGSCGNGATNPPTCNECNGVSEPSAESCDSNQKLSCTPSGWDCVPA